MIRINADEHATQAMLWPVLERFLPHYPDIQVEITVDYDLGDIVAKDSRSGPIKGWSWSARQPIWQGILHLESRKI